ncbi:hypothetical protein [Streptomyces cucumeris]|uniref:hypothetical protein n=1 Tax=Streptomyces cucumeris TaxID=2962890 RepID=UPI003D709D7C
MSDNPGRRRLLIVERAYRGALETQFADVLYLALELNRQQNGADILLRGLAVTCAAADTRPAPSLVVGRRTLDTLPDPRDSVRSLLENGATVWAEEADLALFETGPHWLQPGVRRAGGADPLPDWSAYRSVHFL